MNTLQAAVLGLVQGLTEFLPVSSTAHLRITPTVLGWADPGASFSAVLQLGTLVAIVGYFLPELLRMLRAAVSPERAHRPEARRLVAVVVGTLPIGILGVLFRDIIKGPLRALTVIASSLIAVAVLMALAEKRAKQDRVLDDTTVRDGVLVGLAQALALIPGVSRSGITLCAALALGLKRDDAARFSFLLGVPAIAAAGVFELPAVLHAADITATALGVGLLVSAVSGYLSIAWLLRFLRERGTTPFVVYRVALGLLLFAGLAVGWWS